MSQPWRSVSDQQESTGLWFQAHCTPSSLPLKSSEVWGRLRGLAYAISVVGLADEGEAVFVPGDGLEVEHSAQLSVALEVIEPPFAVGCIDQGTLMRAVNVGRARLQAAPSLVGAVYILASEHGLPTGYYTALGNAEVVVAVFLQELRAFGHRSLIDRLTLVQKACPVGTHAMDDDRSGTYAAVTQIGLPVFVPERTGVFPAIDVDHLVQWRPGAFWLLGTGHIEARVRHADEHPETSVVIAQGRGPSAVGIAVHILELRQVDAAVYLSDDAPVDHILALQDGHSHEVELGAGHVVLLAYADHVRVAVVSQ